MEFDIEIFKGKSFSDLMKDIYSNSTKKDRQINLLIGELRPLIKNIGDATVIVPLIKEYLEVGVKNDEHLIKMVALVQRLESGGNKDAADFFDPEELAKLMEQSEEVGKKLDKEDKE